MQNNQVTDFVEKTRQTILTLSWDAIHACVDSLASQIKPMRPHLLVAVARGGLIPATLLSHKLNCPLEVIYASAYMGTRRTLQKPIVVEYWKPKYDSPHVIVVDDILDTGATLSAIIEASEGSMSKFKFATLVKKQPNRFTEQKLFGMQVSDDTWIKFPWEGDEA